MVNLSVVMFFFYHNPCTEPYGFFLTDSLQRHGSENKKVNKMLDTKLRLKLCQAQVQLNLSF